MIIRRMETRLSQTVKSIVMAASVVALVVSAGAFVPVKVAKADTIEYGKGTFEISAPIVIPDGYSLKGAGTGQTIIKAAPGYTGVLVETSGSTDPTNVTTHHAGVEVHDITIDGNSTASRGVYFFGADDLVLENVEVKNTTDTAIEHEGATDANYVQRQTWSNVTAHDCGGWGVYNGQGTRKVSYVNVKVIKCINGMALAHPEAQVNGLQVVNNKYDGLWVRDSYSLNLSDIRAMANGQYGIHAQGMSYSVGTSWLAENNTKTDVWFDGNSSAPGFTNGTTRGTAISGLVTGHIKYDLGTYQGTASPSLVVDSGVDVTFGNKRLITQ